MVRKKAGETGKADVSNVTGRTRKEKIEQPTKRQRSVVSVLPNFTISGVSVKPQLLASCD